MSVQPCTRCLLEAEKKMKANDDGRDAGKAEARRLERVHNIAAIAAKAGIRRKYLGKSLENFVPDYDPGAVTAAEEFIRDFQAGDRPSLYLFSERPDEKVAPGAGKTHIAAAIAQAILLDPAVHVQDIRFAFVPRILLDIQNSFKNPTLSELEVVDRYAKPELMIWDDFGAEKLSDYAARTLFTILYEREGRSNIFTSNLSLEQIEERSPTGYMQRMTSRIAGEARLMRFVGPDWRLKRERVA